MLAKLNNNARLSIEGEEGMESQQAGTSSPPPKKREKRDQRKTPPKKKEKRDQRKPAPKKKEKARKKMAEEEPLEEGEQDMDVQQRRKVKPRYRSFVNDYYGFEEPAGFRALDHHGEKTIYGCAFSPCQGSYQHFKMAAKHMSLCYLPRKRKEDGQKKPRTLMDSFEKQEKELGQCIRTEPANVFRTKAFHLIVLLGVHQSTDLDMYFDVLHPAMTDDMEKRLDQAPKEDQDRLREFMQRRLENRYLGPKMWRMGGPAAGFRFGFCYEFIRVEYRKDFEENLVKCWSRMGEEEKEEARRLFGSVNLRSWGTDPLAPEKDVLEYNIITTVEEYDKASEQERLCELKVDDKANWKRTRQNVKKGQNLPGTCSGIVNYEELVEPEEGEEAGEPEEGEDLVGQIVQEDDEDPEKEEGEVEEEKEEEPEETQEPGEEEDEDEDPEKQEEQGEQEEDEEEKEQEEETEEREKEDEQEEEPETETKKPEGEKEYYERFYSEPKKKRNKLSENQLKITKEQAAWLQTKLPPALDIIRFKSTGDGIHGDFTLRVNVKELKQQTWADLKAWERKVCEICRKGKEAELKVENDVDFEVIPTDFTYIIDYKEGEGVQIHKGSIIHILPANTFSQFRRPVRGRKPERLLHSNVITEKVAEERGKAYDAAGATYLFDLDFNDSANVEFAVDAKKYGNVGHFINHSCDPNLQIRAVWNECLDERMPRLAFFSRRTIKMGEELTFNYRMHDSPSLEAVDEETSGTATKIPCLCGAENCRKYLN